MMNELVKQSAKKSLESDDLYALGGAHPNGEHWISPARGGLVKTVQFTPMMGGPFFQDFGFHAGYPPGIAQR